MLKAVQGVYRDGKVELLETPLGVKEAKVVVTFLPVKGESRVDPPLTEEEIDDLRFKLAAWEEDWNAPGMEVYEDYWQ